MTNEREASAVWGVLGKGVIRVLGKTGLCGFPHAAADFVGFHPAPQNSAPFKLKNCLFPRFSCQYFHTVVNYR